jgi:hypothetical protein
MKGKNMNRADKRVRGRAVHIPTLPAKLSDESRLSRPEAALWLADNGAPVAPQRLAILATTGGGPPYSIVFGKARYRVADLREWLAKLTSATFTSAAERLEHQRRVKQRRNPMSDRDNSTLSTTTNPASPPPLPSSTHTKP